MAWMIGSTPPNMDPNSVRRVRSPKSPSDVVPITCDYTGALAAIDCDTLDSTFTPATSVIRNDGQAADCYVTGTPAIGNPTNGENQTRVTVWLSAGSAGFEYLVSVSVKSEDGQLITRSFIIPVMIR
jgi:hypothetical protein